MKLPHCFRHEKEKSNKKDETVFRVDLFNEEDISKWIEEFSSLKKKQTGTQ